jgi:O-antigen ligase
MIRHSGLILAVGLALLLLWAPLPFGGVTPWASALLAGLCFAALALAALALESPAALRPALIPAAALAGIALLGVLQSVPLPRGVVAALSPEHAGLQRQAAELGGEAPARLTLAASATRRAALAWAAVAAAFLAAAVAGQRREHRRWLFGAILAGGLFQVFFGARDWFSRATSLWGVDLHASATRLRGTFVNPNHAAAYLELALPVAFALGWWAARRAREEPQAERRILMVAPPVILWLTLFAGLSFTGSRAGLLAAMAGVTLQGVLAARARHRWWMAPLGAAAALAGVAVVAALGWREGLGRLLATSATDVSLGARLREYGTAVELWGRFPLIGAGLGAFRDAFPLVQPADLEGALWHPHSDYLEVLATAGLGGLALLGIGLWALTRRLGRVLREGARSEDRAAALAGLGILASLAIHETMDFGLSMPGTAVSLAVLLGAVAAARTRSAQLSRAGQDPAAVEPLQLHHVEPAADRHLHGKKRRRSGRGPHRKSAYGGAVEP